MITTEPSPIAIHALFAIPVLEITERYKLNGEELNYLTTCKMKSNVRNDISERTNILDDEKMKNIKNYIEQGIKYYIETILCPENNDIEIYITESWCNFTSKGQSHHLHAHPNSILSGCLYVDVDKEDKIHFYNYTTYNRINIEVDKRKYNKFNSSSWWLPVENGELIIFDSSLSHSVEEITTDHTRISISFNTFIKGEIGIHTTLLNLK
jgi:uncharacterized protein (TIGR02466 family)